MMIWRDGKGAVKNHGCATFFARRRCHPDDVLNCAIDTLFKEED